MSDTFFGRLDNLFIVLKLKSKGSVKYITLALLTIGLLFFLKVGLEQNKHCCACDTTDDNGKYPEQGFV